jgi:hypothetical protein
MGGFTKFIEAITKLQTDRFYVILVMILVCAAYFFMTAKGYI